MSATQAQRLMPSLLNGFVVLMLADLALTCYLLSAYAGHVRENNPLVAFWFAHQVAWVVVVGKLFGTLLLRGVLGWLARWVPQQMVWWLALYCAIMLVVDSLDLRVLWLVR
jgi:hypothetical protein